MSPELNGKTRQHDGSQSKKSEAGKPTHTEQDSNHGKENVSSDVQVKSLEKEKSPSEAIEASTDFETNLKNSGTKDEKSEKPAGKTSATLEATSSQSDNSNVSAEEKNIPDLEVARLAVNRLKNVIKTVTRVNSASQTVDIAEDKGNQAQQKKQIVSNKPSLNAGPSITHEKNSGVRNPELRKVNPGRRGESGPKVLKHDAGVETRNKEDDIAKSVTVEDAKLAKQKGESILRSKNEPGSKVASKNTRDMPSAELLFEHQQAKAILSRGPKHTPPLKEKESLVRVKKCENIGRKKRKGEAFTVDCVTEDTSKQVGSLSKEGVEATDQSLTTETNKASSTKSDIQPFSTDNEAVLMKQTSTDEISATSSRSDSTTSERTSEAKVLEESKNRTNSTDDVNRETSSKKGVDKPSANANKNSEAKGAEDVSLKNKASDGKQHEQAATTGSENPETKGLENGEKSIAEATAAKSKARDTKVDHGGDHIGATAVISENPENSSDGRRGSFVSTSSKVNQEFPTVDYKARQALDAKKASQNIKEQVKNAEFLHSVGAGSSVFETSFMNVQTDGSLQDLSDEECRHIEGVEALIVRNEQFSAWLSLDTKNIE